MTGNPGTGKSVTLRILADRLLAQRDVKIGVRPNHRLACTISTGRWETCSASSCVLTTAGPAGHERGRAGCGEATRERNSGTPSVSVFATASMSVPTLICIDWFCQN